MSRASALTRELIDAGLKHDRPHRSMRELLAEHRALLAALIVARPAVEVSAIEESRGAKRDRSLGLSERSRRWRDALVTIDALIARCEAPAAEGTAP